MDYDKFIECLILLDDIRDFIYQLKYHISYGLDQKELINDDLKKISEIVGGI